MVSQNTWWNGKKWRPWGTVWSGSVLFEYDIISDKLLYEILRQSRWDGFI